jgi:NAD(P) transhydrogenase
MPRHEFDLLVLGSGPAGQKAAIQAAKLGRKAAIVERKRVVGGVCVNTGTIPSKTLREAVIHLTGLAHRSHYGQSYRVKDEITIEDLFWRTQRVIQKEIDVINDQLTRNHVSVLCGDARFIDPHTVDVDGRKVSADKIVIAVGTRPVRPSSVEFDDRHIIDSDGILKLDKLPESMVVVGAGVIGIEYAAMFAALGTKVTVVERGDRLLPFCDIQVVEALQYHLRESGVVFRFRETVTAVEAYEAGSVTLLDSGKRVLSDTVLYSAGRQGATDDIDIEKAGLQADDRGRIAVDKHFRTAVRHIYAAGDVIGFPSLAATSMEQGRLAACHAFGLTSEATHELLPFGIYTIPEISYVGKTEEELTQASIPYEVGIARYRELARGQIVGDANGLLKLLVDPQTHRLLGVHVFGTGATEIVHIGQVVMGLGGTIEHIVNTVFNFPTLSEAYKVAALDALNKMRAMSRVMATRKAA